VEVRFDFMPLGLFKILVPGRELKGQTKEVRS